MKKLFLLSISILLFSCDKSPERKLSNNYENQFARLAIDNSIITSNIYNKETVVENTAINLQGYMISSIGNCSTDFIKLDPNTTYSYSGAKALGNYNCIYNSDYVKVRSLGAVTNGTFTTTSNEVYARFTVGNAPAGNSFDKGMLQINKGVTVDYLQPYGLIKENNWSDELPENAALVLLDFGQSNCAGASNNKTGGSYKSERQRSGIIKEWNFTNNSFQNQFIDGNAFGMHGINLTFQKLYFKLNRQFYYINCGKSGTAIAKHLPPSGSVFLTTNTAVTTAINQLITQGKRPYIWVRWTQGEGDSTSLSSVNLYTSRQIQFLNYWKNKLGQNVPFIFSGINVHGTELEQSFDTAINQTKINLDNQGLVYYYPVTEFSTDDGNEEHRNYLGYYQEAQVVWDLINEIRPIEITQALN
jgi:hypothetical protein